MHSTKYGYNNCLQSIPNHRIIPNKPQHFQGQLSLLSSKSVKSHAKNHYSETIKQMANLTETQSLNKYECQLVSKNAAELKTLCASKHVKLCHLLQQPDNIYYLNIIQKYIEIC